MTRILGVGGRHAGCSAWGMRKTGWLVLAAIALAPAVSRADDEVVLREKKMYSAPLLAGGIAAVVAGVAAVPTGFLLVMIRPPDVPCVPCTQPDHTPQDIAGVTLMAAGGAALVSGIVMIALGAHRVPIRVGPFASAGLSLSASF